MIQRKQTIFLLIAVALLISMCFMPLAQTTVSPIADSITNSDGSITKITAISANDILLNVWGLYYDNVKEVDFTYFTVLLFLTIALLIATVFMFKKRLIQIKFCYMIWVFLLGLLIFEGIYIYRLNELLSSSLDFTVATNYSVSILFPMISLIFVWFAYKGIIKDEALVRSLDRIR